MLRTITSTLVALAGLTAAGAQTVAVTGGRVVTNTNAGVIDGGTVVFTNGRITAVGPNVAVPSGARVIDAQGKWVTPGLFAPFTQLGMVEIALENSGNDSNAGESQFSVALNVADAFNPNSAHIPPARVEGVTRAGVYGGGSGDSMFGATGAVVDTTGRLDSITQRDAFVYAVYSNGGSRMSAMTWLDAAFADARAFPGRYQNGGQGDALNRLDAAALRPVVRGDVPLLIFANRASDLLDLIEFKRRNAPVDLIIAGADEAHLVADQLAAADIDVLVNPVDNLPGSLAGLAASFDSAQVLQDAGVRYAFLLSESDYFNVRLLTQDAGNAVTHGLAWDDAFRAISLSPAEMFDLDDRFGSLEPGKTADVVIWDGDPLEVLSSAETVFIDGVATDMTTRQSKLRDRYMNLPQPGDRPLAYIKP